MKVKDIMKKINYGTSKIPVFLQEGVNLYSVLCRSSFYSISRDDASLKVNKL